MSIAREQADLQRAEAKRLFSRVLGLPVDTPSAAVDRIVDCIIGAALLEMVAVHEEVKERNG